MIRSTILSCVLLIIVGCGAQSSPEERESSISDDIATLVSGESNVTADSDDVNGTSLLEDLNGSSTPTLPVTITEGNESTPTPTPVEDEPSLLPPKINVDFPTLLKPQSTVEERNSTKEGNTTTQVSVGYQQLQRSISKIDSILEKVKINRIILDQVMPEIQQRCEGMIVCLFQPELFSVVMDNQTRMSIEAIGERNQTLVDTNRSEILLGEVGFYRYDEEESYHYGVRLDVLGSHIYPPNKQVKREVQTIKWQEENHDVLTIYDYEDNESNRSVTLHYLVDELGNETMYLYDRDDRQQIGYQENTSLILSKSDANSSESNESSYSLTSNSILKQAIGDEVNTSSFSSNVEIDANSTQLLFAGSIMDEASGEAVEVDTALSCDSNESCTESNLTAEILDPSEEMNIDLFELRIVGGNLADGTYLLLAPDVAVESLTLRNIFEQSLGSFTVFDGEKQGALHSDAFLYLLNSLTIVRINTDEASESLFEVVSLTDKPTLRVVK